ncbi:MAG TPA: hypothetical protein VL172_22065, partial [Kofleriaceae bacterium]|nr:hypothetical protein [Kofleriaceae bacterium]
MTKTLFVCLLTTAALAAACKGDTKYKDTPDTLRKLDDCRNLSGEKDARIAQLEKELADYKAKNAGEVTINIAGDGTWVIKGGAGPNVANRNPPDPKGNAKDAELYKAFKDHVDNSRGAIKKCYQNALKKDSSLDQRVITINLSVKYAASGKVQNVGMDKRISDTFSACMDNVAGGWQLPAAP